MAGIVAEERAKIELELAKVQSSGELEMARWNQINQLQTAQQDERRSQELREAHHDAEMSRINLQAERQASQFEAEKADAQIERNLTEERGQAEIAMDLFAQVQDRKERRLAKEAEREQARLDSSRAGSDKLVDTIAEIAKSSKDSEVHKETVRQLGEMRKSDVDAEGQAYIDSDD